MSKIKFSSPCKGESIKPLRFLTSNSIPRITFIQCFPILLPKPLVFSLEILLFMMLRLSPDILAHGLDMHRAHAKFAVACLPREIGIPYSLLLDPTRRRSLDVFNNFRRRMVFGLREQDVNVVTHRVDFDQRRIVVLEKAGYVGPEFTALLVAQELMTTLRAKDEVGDNVCE